MTALPTAIGGLRELADRYDAFVLDLWGTLHDGARPYPGVIDCLETLQAEGKRIVLLSNAPRRTDTVIDRVNGIGIGRHLYTTLVTSGEAGWQALLTRGEDAAAEPYLHILGPRCFHLGPVRDRGMLDGLPIEPVADTVSCDFILCTGLAEPLDTPDAHHAILEPAARRGLPMVCVNPDLIIHRVGKLEYCAGALAERYAEMGGRVHWYGKPYAEVYDYVRAELGGIERRRVLTVGDSLRTDIAGAVAAGLDSLLLTGGIHVEELGGEGEIPPPDRIVAACSTYGAWPTWVARRFVW